MGYDAWARRTLSPPGRTLSQLKSVKSAKSVDKAVAFPPSAFICVHPCSSVAKKLFAVNAVSSSPLFRRGGAQRAGVRCFSRKPHPPSPLARLRGEGGDFPPYTIVNTEFFPLHPDGEGMPEGRG